MSLRNDLALSDKRPIPDEQVAYEVIYQYLQDCKDGIYRIDQFLRWLHKPRGEELCEIAGINPAYLEMGIKRMGI